MAALFGGALVSQAQDLITTKSGDDIEAKVLEVTQTEVKYKRYSNLEGPVFTLSKSDVLMVRYENGEKDIFTTTDSPSAASSFSNNAPAYVPNTSKEVHVGMRYSEYKHYYNPKEYIPQKGDTFSRGLAGVASFFIPGLGQCIDGEWGRGLAFFGGNILMNLALYSTYRVDDYTGQYVASSGTLPMLIAVLAYDIWSISDAVRVAKIKNMFYQDIRGQRAALDLKLEPFFAYTPTGSVNGFKPAAGLSLRLAF